MCWIGQLGTRDRTGRGTAGRDRCGRYLTRERLAEGPRAAEQGDAKEMRGLSFSAAQTESAHARTRPRRRGNTWFHSSPLTGISWSTAPTIREHFQPRGVEAIMCISVEASAQGQLGGTYWIFMETSRKKNRLCCCSTRSRCGGWQAIWCATMRTLTTAQAAGVRTKQVLAATLAADGRS